MEWKETSELRNELLYDILTLDDHNYRYHLLRYIPSWFMTDLEIQEVYVISRSLIISSEDLIQWKTSLAIDSSSKKVGSSKLLDIYTETSSSEMREAVLIRLMAHQSFSLWEELQIEFTEIITTNTDLHMKLLKKLLLLQTAIFAGKEPSLSIFGQNDVFGDIAILTTFSDLTADPLALEVISEKFLVKARQIINNLEHPKYGALIEQLLRMIEENFV